MTSSNMLLQRDYFMILFSRVEIFSFPQMKMCRMLQSLWIWHCEKFLSLVDYCTQNEYYSYVGLFYIIEFGTTI